MKKFIDAIDGSIKYLISSYLRYLLLPIYESFMSVPPPLYLSVVPPFLAFMFIFKIINCYLENK